jgi:hypothetical protein
MLIRMLAAIALVPSAAMAQGTLGDDSRLAVMEDPVRIVFQSGVTPPTSERLRVAVSVAASTRDWRIISDKDGKWELMREVGGMHMIRVAVTCGDAECAVRYLSSTNLLYRERPIAGTSMRVIHRNYNTWARELGTSLAGGIGVPAHVSSGFALVSTVDAVPFLDESGRQGYRQFLAKAKPRAFAIGPNGAWGSGEVSTPVYSGGSAYLPPSSNDPAGSAVAQCNQAGAGKCRLYAIDDQVVWQAP